MKAAAALAAVLLAIAPARADGLADVVEQIRTRYVPMGLTPTEVCLLVRARYSVPLSFTERAGGRVEFEVIEGVGLDITSYSVIYSYTMPSVAAD